MDALKELMPFVEIAGFIFGMGVVWVKVARAEKKNDEQDIAINSVRQLVSDREDKIRGEMSATVDKIHSKIDQIVLNLK